MVTELLKHQGSFAFEISTKGLRQGRIWAVMSDQAVCPKVANSDGDDNGKHAIGKRL